MKSTENGAGYVLGLDIGVASTGWARIGLNNKDKPASILDAGVHIFDAGVEGDVESGRDEARGTARREARSARRSHWRRQRRRKKLLGLLQRAGLMPSGDIDSPQAIHDYLLALDAQLRQKHQKDCDRVTAQVLPYRLRAVALDHPLEPFELGRALYHLAQRRGFLSNRKSLEKEEDEGVVKAGITDLQASMKANGARTLGEFFAGLDPEAERIRGKWTARQMYIDEFNSIWDAQSPHHPGILIDELRKEVYRAIFFQRPLKSARHLIGRCELVPGARRAAMADRLVQRFRILQKVNDLLVIPASSPPRRLTTEERDRLLTALSCKGDLTFARIRSKSVLALPKGTTFNFEQRDEEKKLPGYRTDQKMRTVFGDRWDDMVETERDDIVLEVLSFQNPDALARRATKAWGLDPQCARTLAETRLEQGYAAHSRRALRRLVDRMEDGTPYATARRELFPDSFESTEPVDRLPPVLKAVPSLRNPAVARALTELRKLVNEIVRVYGKPTEIRVELARDLKRGRKERERISKDIDTRTKLREKAKERILREAGVSEPRRSDVEKALLWDECGGKCPYTGRSIDFRSLFGANPQFDVEHILPFSRSLDNSFVNKTLCYHEENREHKRNRTPFEAYSNDPTRYAEILTRVRGFQGRSTSKLHRFEMQEIPEDFVSRQLNDTRYASRLAGDYLALLYGGRSDDSGTQRIQISTGGITFHLRNEWQLNSILSDGGVKTRDDHRHHAVDALTVALASPGLVAKLQRAAEGASEAGRRLFAPVQEPWAGFLEQACETVLGINVSSRLKKRIAGDLHEDTNYSKEHVWERTGKKSKTVRHVRKPIDGMTVGQVDAIVDPIVREKVREWIPTQSAKGKKEGIVCFPTIRTRDGREIPIKSARIRKVVSVVPVGDGARTRYVKPGANHHTVIVASLDEFGNEKSWEDHPVTRLEVHQRKAAGLPIIQMEWGDNKRFVMSIARGECFMIEDDKGTPCLWLCTTVSKGDNWFRLNHDARTREARRQSGDRPLRASGRKLRLRNARKVRVTYLGEIVPAND